MKPEKEIEVVTLMIRHYCHGKHKTRKHELCPECAGLSEYVKMRRIKCPHKENKPFCANCKIHCYKQEMRQRIREVMRYSGPRIVFRHPFISLKHLIESKRQRNKESKADI